jgi:prefoldin alpha subunit
LYVPGKLSDLENVIVDVGTGYYVKKVRCGRCDPHYRNSPPLPQSRAQATKYYQSKVDYLQSNLETLQETILKKQEDLTFVTNVLQSKIQAQSQGSTRNAKDR